MEGLAFYKLGLVSPACVARPLGSQSVVLLHSSVHPSSGPAAAGGSDVPANLAQYLGLQTPGRLGLKT